MHLLHDPVIRESEKQDALNPVSKQRSATHAAIFQGPRGPQHSSHSTHTRTHFRSTFRGLASSHITSARANPPRPTSRRPRNLPNKSPLPQSPRPIPLLTFFPSSSRAVDLRTRQTTHVGDHDSVSERRNHPAGGSARADPWRESPPWRSSAEERGQRKLVLKLQPINSKTFGNVRPEMRHEQSQKL